MKNHKDLDGRQAKNAICEIAADLLRGKQLCVAFRCSHEYPIHHLSIAALPVQYPDFPFLVHVASYQLEPHELFSDQIIVRSTTGRKVYWRGYE